MQTPEQDPIQMAIDIAATELTRNQRRLLEQFRRGELFTDDWNDPTELYAFARQADGSDPDRKPIIKRLDPDQQVDIAVISPVYNAISIKEELELNIGLLRERRGSKRQAVCLKNEANRLILETLINR